MQPRPRRSQIAELVNLQSSCLETQKALETEVEAKAKLAKENKSLENFRNVNLPKEDEFDDTGALDHYGLLEKIMVF